MSFNSAAYLAYQERLLEPDSVLVKGNHRWHQPIVTQHAKIAEPLPDYRTEEDIERMEDDYLKERGA